MKTVLVVEDDRDIRWALQEGLESEGYRVVTAQDGRDGLEKIRLSPKPHLVLLDFMMPVMNGREFLDRVLADDDLKRIPVVIVSATASELGTHGATEVLRKPVDLDCLLDVVARLTSASSR